MPLHSQYITHSSGETTHYIVDDFTDPWKSRETIILQGGFARHTAFFYHWVPSLSRRYNVIRRDLRGHGYSSAPAIAERPDTYTLQSILSDLIDTLDHLGLQKVHFFGESTSGILGEILAAQHPDRLLSLTICSSPTYLPKSTQEFLAMGEESWPGACRKLGSRGWGEALASQQGTMSSPDPGYRSWWLDQVSVNSAEGLASYAEFLSTLDSRQYLSKITVPMLILAPRRSAATKIEDQRDIHRQVPGSMIVEIDGAGHEIYVDSADECQNAFLKFLKSIDRT